MKTAVLSIVHGRHEHLSRVLAACASGDEKPGVVVIAAMADDGVHEVAGRFSELSPVVVDLPDSPGGLPLAAARNAAASRAIELGAEALIFLDVDCIPSPTLIARYRQVFESVRVTDAPLILAGEVAYLPSGVTDFHPASLSAVAAPHPARPVLDPDTLRFAADVTLFWSLSFAMKAGDWARAGGFDERYVGYGGEDTDFAERVRSLGGRMLWVGGARAYHQFHENSMPPFHHLDDIVRNARIFHATWGWWPMSGWLHAFHRAGLIDFDGNEIREARNPRDRGERAPDHDN